MRIDNNVKCDICAHKLVCSFSKQVNEFKDKIDEVLLTEPLNLTSAMKWECRYFWFIDDAIKSINKEKQDDNRQF